MTKVLGCKVPDPIYDRFANLNMTISKALREAINDYLKKIENTHK